MLGYMYQVKSSLATTFIMLLTGETLLGLWELWSIILFRISSKKLSKCFYYSQVTLIMLKIIPSFYNFFNFCNRNIQ